MRSLKNIFKKFFIFEELLLIFCIVSSFTFKYNNDCTIEWKKNKHIQREDFKGKKTHKGAVASTVYSIHTDIVEKNQVFIVSVKTFFLCDKSWILLDKCGDDVVLHEQTHFDIAELFARQLREKLHEITVADFKDATYKLDSLYKIINVKMDVYQDKYDLETDHSLICAEQKKWNKKIARELKRWHKYAETDFKLKNIIINTDHFNAFVK